MKELVYESNRIVGEEFGRKLSEKFMRKRKLFWKKVKKERDVRDMSGRMN